MTTIEAHATPVRIDYSGVVSVSGGGPTLPAVGTLVVGAIVIDDDASLYAVDPPVFGHPGYLARELVGPPYRSAINAPPLSPSSDLVALEVFDNDLTLLGVATPGDEIAFSAKRSGFFFSLALIGPTSAFAGTGLPSVDLLRGPWSSRILTGQDDIARTSAGRFEAIIDRLVVSVIPEPDMLWLVALGLGIAITDRRTHTARPRDHA